MSKLSIELIQNHLMEEDAVKKAAVQQQALSKHRKPAEVGKPKDPSSKLTKITQIDVPTSTGKKASKSSSSKAQNGIPQADFASTYIDKKNDVPKGSTAKNEKSPSVPKVAKGEKPNQTTKMKEIKGAIKNTEGGKQSKGSVPTAKFAHEYTDKMPHGNSNLKSSGDAVPTVGKPKVEKMSSTTRPKGSTKKAKDLGSARDGQKPKQVDSTKGSLPTPSDAPKKATWKTEKKGHNVVEGVQVRIAGSDKIKAEFAIVSRDVLQTMKENYAQHGYTLEFTRCRAGWKDDRTFLKLVREAMDAKYNNVPKYFKEIRREALSRFHNLCRGSYSDSLYESRDQFSTIVVEAFERVMETAEKKYLDSLDIFECTARVQIAEDIIDVDMVTEASDHAMALRQIHNTVMEEYGLDAKLVHAFVDGKKYRPNQITTWSRKA